MLCETAGVDRSWFRVIRPWYGHDDHFHVRLNCPAGETNCVSQAPPPEGDGCGVELAWWLGPGAMAAARGATATASPCQDTCGPPIRLQHGADRWSDAGAAASAGAAPIGPRLLITGRPRLIGGHFLMKSPVSFDHYRCGRRCPPTLENVDINCSTWCHFFNTAAFHSPIDKELLNGPRTLQ